MRMEEGGATGTEQVTGVLIRGRFALTRKLKLQEKYTSNSVTWNKQDLLWQRESPSNTTPTLSSQLGFGNCLWRLGLRSLYWLSELSTQVSNSGQDFGTSHLFSAKGLWGSPTNNFFSHSTRLVLDQMDGNAFSHLSHHQIIGRKERQTMGPSGQEGEGLPWSRGDVDSVIDGLRVTPWFSSHLDFKKCGQLFTVWRTGVRKNGKVVQIVASVSKKLLMTKGKLSHLEKAHFSSSSISCEGQDIFTLV